MRNYVITACCLALIGFIPALATAGSNGVAVKGSTLGGGVEYERTFNDNLGFRLGVNYLQFDGDFTAGDIDYEADVNLQTASGLIDWYPLSGAFRFTAGVMLNGNDADITASPAGPITIGDVVYSPQMVGSLNGSVSFNDIAPYAGVGWSSGRGNQAGLSVAFDIGILFQGAPNIDDYHATGPLAGNPAFEAQLDKEIANLEDELDPYQYYPVVAFTLTYRF